MNELHSQMRESILNFLWNQWDSLGAPARGVGSAVPFVIDPEALLLATMRFGATDARMADLVADWVPKNGAFLNLQRLKNLQSGTKLGTSGKLAALGSLMESAGFKNWKSLSDSLAKTDSAFGTGESRSMSRSPDPSRPEVFLLKMRMLFGLGSRPEIITWLLTHRSGHAAEIARDTGWLSKSVQAIINDLEASGMLLSHMEGRKKLVRFNSRNSILNPGVSDELRWFTQAPFYMGILYVIQTCERLEKTPDASDSLKSILIRQDLAAINVAFRHSGIRDPFMAMASLKGADARKEFEAGCGTLVVKLNSMDFP